MTFQEFIEKWNGRAIDFDGVYGPQCVDLIRQYLLECLVYPGSSIKPVVGAKDMYEKYDAIVDGNYFDRVPNTPTGVPKEGDIVLWGNSTFGHVAIFVEGDANSFRSFDQNFPSGSFCHIQNHTYANVLGWLRPKEMKPDLQQQLDQMRLERDRNWTWFAGLCDIIRVNHVYDIARAELEKLVKLEDALQKKEEEMALKEQQIAEMRAELSTIGLQLTEAVQVNTEAQKTILEQGEQLKKQQLLMSQLQTRITELEKVNPIEQYSGFDLVLMGFKRWFFPR